jgi:hypothetical protein
VRCSILPVMLEVSDTRSTVAVLPVAQVLNTMRPGLIA